MATLSMVSVPVAPSSLSLSTRGRTSSVSLPAKVSAVFSYPPFCPPLATICLCILCTLVSCFSNPVLGMRGTSKWRICVQLYGRVWGVGRMVFCEL
jgi:hypothetical protein